MTNVSALQGEFLMMKLLLPSVITIGSTKVNKVKNFSGPYYVIKRVLTFVSGVQEFVLLDFISQNKVKILHKLKLCQNCLCQKFPYKNKKTDVSFIFFWIFELILCAVSFDHFETVAIVKMRAVIEKETALNIFLYLVAYLSSYLEKAINALYELA